jgi:hypothetical protein
MKNENGLTMSFKDQEAFLKAYYPLIKKNPEAMELLLKFNQAKGGHEYNATFLAFEKKLNSLNLKDGVWTHEEVSTLNMQFSSDKYYKERKEEYDKWHPLYRTLLAIHLIRSLVLVGLMSFAFYFVSEKIAVSIIIGILVFHLWNRIDEKSEKEAKKYTL